MLSVFRASGDCLRISVPLDLRRSPESQPPPSTNNSAAVEAGSNGSELLENDLLLEPTVSEATATDAQVLLGDLRDRMHESASAFDEQRRRDGNPIVVGETDSPTRSPVARPRDRTASASTPIDATSSSTTGSNCGKMAVVPVLNYSSACSSTTSRTSSRTRRGASIAEDFSDGHERKPEDFAPPLAVVTDKAEIKQRTRTRAEGEQEQNLREILSGSDATQDEYGSDQEEGRSKPRNGTQENNGPSSSGDFAADDFICVADARRLVAASLSDREGRNVPATLCFLANNDPDSDRFGETLLDAELLPLEELRSRKSTSQEAEMEPHDEPSEHRAENSPSSSPPVVSVLVRTLHIPNVYNALQDASTVEEAREVVFHMSETELNQSFYRIFRYWGRVGINLLQGCLRGHGPLAWKTAQIQAILEDPRFLRWRELDAITKRTIFQDVVFYLDSVLLLSKMLLSKYEALEARKRLQKKIQDEQANIAMSSERSDQVDTAAASSGAASSSSCVSTSVVVPTKGNNDLAFSSTSAATTSTSSAPQRGVEQAAAVSPRGRGAPEVLKTPTAPAAATKEADCCAHDSEKPRAFSSNQGTSDIVFSPSSRRRGERDNEFWWKTGTARTGSGGTVPSDEDAYIATGVARQWVGSSSRSLADVETGVVQLPVEELSANNLPLAVVPATTHPVAREKALLSERVAFLSTDTERLTHDAVVLRRSGASSVVGSKDSATLSLVSKPSVGVVGDPAQEAEAASSFPPATLTTVKILNGEDELRCEEKNKNDDGAAARTNKRPSSRSEESACAGSTSTPSSSTAGTSKSCKDGVNNLPSPSKPNANASAGSSQGEKGNIQSSQFHDNHDPPPAPVTGGLSRIPHKSEADAVPLRKNSLLPMSRTPKSSDDLDLVSRLFDHKDLKGMTAFMLGVRRNHIGFIKWLLKEYQGGKYAAQLIRAKNEFSGNETPFMLASRHGLEIIVRLMLSCCDQHREQLQAPPAVELRPTPDNVEPSEVEGPASDTRSLSAWELLNARTTEDKSAIMFGAQYNRTAVCKILLEHENGAYRESLLRQSDKENRDLLQIAKSYDAEGVVALLNAL
ncbi:unnamed protein product [Amoebophrya sp. A120]|nr:unnamed protein product [Amoebophrya sp. A120]|eukprot:GSA120T00002270001.1